MPAPTRKMPNAPMKITVMIFVFTVPSGLDGAWSTLPDAGRSSKIDAGRDRVPAVKEEDLHGVDG